MMNSQKNGQKTGGKRKPVLWFLIDSQVALLTGSRSARNEKIRDFSVSAHLSSSFCFDCIEERAPRRKEIRKGLPRRGIRAQKESRAISPHDVGGEEKETEDAAGIEHHAFSFT